MSQNCDPWKVSLSAISSILRQRRKAFGKSTEQLLGSRHHFRSWMEQHGRADPDNGAVCIVFHALQPLFMCAWFLRSFGCFSKLCCQSPFTTLFLGCYKYVGPKVLKPFNLRVLLSCLHCWNSWEKAWAITVDATYTIPAA